MMGNTIKQLNDIWERVYRYSLKKVREKYLQKHGYDVKCPNCNTWRSISVLTKEVEPLNVDEGVWAIQCGQCDHISYWSNLIAPFLVHVNRYGSPVENENDKGVYSDDDVDVSFR